MKKIFTILFILITFICFKNNAYANTIYKAIITGTNVNIRVGPGTNYSIIKALSYNSSYNLVTNEIYPSEKTCDDGWYKLYYSGDNTGYICSSYIDVTTSVFEEVGITECEKELESKGFTSTYFAPLCSLKEKYPSWNFVADKTGLDFNTAVEKESSGTKSKIETSYDGYKNTDSYYDFLTNSFTAVESGTWYVADKRVVAYYLDPRVWLNESYIFQFEKLSFDESYQNIDTIKRVLVNRDVSEKAEVIYNAGKEFNVNPVYLASRIRQETGGNYTNNSLMGKSITYDNITYEHVYNAYNIGANTGYLDGLYWAVKLTTHNRPWTTLDKTIIGGASFISQNYINAGQDTGYYQKFNVSSYAISDTYSHQYMANVRAASSEGKMNYNAYNSMEILDMPFTFVIPIYDNLPENMSVLPSVENPNNHLKDIKVDGNSIKDFNHDNYNYEYYISPYVDNVLLEGIVIVEGTKVEGDLNVTLTSEEKEKNVTLRVIAKNGDIKEYVIKLIKSEGIALPVKEIMESLPIKITDNYISGLNEGFSVTSLKNLVNAKSSNAILEIKSANNIIKTDELLVTGDMVTITNDSDTQSYLIVLNGDISGDANITIIDLLKIQKHILNYNKLDGAYLKAADTNNDGLVNIVDLLRIQKHILGYIKLGG